MSNPIKFIQPHKGKSSGKDIRSRFTADGSYSQNLPRVRTVGELREVLAQLPDSLPLNGARPDDFDEEDDEGGYWLVWFNVGADSEHLAFDDQDLFGDDDEEDDED